jgi:hypothetical protein
VKATIPEMNGKRRPVVLHEFIQGFRTLNVNGDSLLWTFKGVARIWLPIWQTMTTLCSPAIIPSLGSYVVAESKLPVWQSTRAEPIGRLIPG